MKRIILFGLLLFSGLSSIAQSRVIIRGDSVYIQRDGGNGELILRNGTRDSTGGVLTNIWGGRTAFVRSRINGDTLFIGGDTIILPTGPINNKLDSVTIHVAADPDPDTLYQWRAGVSELVGLIPKGGGGTPNLDNVGTGYRWYKPGTGEFKTVAPSWGINWDSTSNTNALTAKIDSAAVPTMLRRNKGLDSLRWAMREEMIDSLDKTTQVEEPLYVAPGANKSLPDTVKINPKTLGTLYQKNSWTSSADFTMVGSPTIAYTSNKINLSGGNQSISATVGTSNSAYNQVIRITSYGATLLEQWKAYVRWTVNVAPASGTTGFAFGTYSINALSSRSHAMGYFNMSTGTGTGKVFFVGGTGNTTALSSVNALTFSQNDQLEMTVERVFNRISVTVNNLTTGAAGITILYQYDPTNASAINLPNTSNFAIANLGGAYIIDSISITSDVKKFPNLLMVGDSKFAGYSTPFDVRVGSLIERKFPGTVVSAGPTDVSADVVARLAEIQSLQPKQILVCIGRNDEAFSVSQVTREANLSNIDNTLTGAGYPTYWLNGIFENQNAQTSVSAYIESIAGSRVLKTLQAGNQSGAGHVHSDNIHPSIKGAQFVAEYILNSGKLTNYGGFLNDKFNPQWITTARTADSLYLGQGTIRDLGGTYTPAPWSPGDHVMREGAALTAAFGLAIQRNRLVISEASDATMSFRNYTGNANQNTKAFRFYTAGATTGSQTERMFMTIGGNLAFGNLGTVVPFSTATGGDIWMYGGSNAAIRAANASTAGMEGAFHVLTAASNTEVRNYSATGEIRMFTANGVAGGQVQTFTLTNDGKLGIGNSSPQNQIHTTLSSAITNTIGYPFRLTHTTSGSAANGFGLGLIYEMENSSAGNYIAGKRIYHAIDNNSASEDVDIIDSSMRAGVMTEQFRITSLGSGRFSSGLFLGALNNGVGGTDSVLVIKDTEVKKVAASSLIGTSITSINSQTGPSISFPAGNGMQVNNTSNTITIGLGGAFTASTLMGGAGNQLSLGTTGSKLSSFAAVSTGNSTLQSDARIFLLGNISYSADFHSSDANHTVAANTQILQLNTASLTTDRTVTLPSAASHGQTLTIVVDFASSGSHFVLASAIQDNKTGSTFTQLEWATTYDLMVDNTLNWKVIRKY